MGRGEFGRDGFERGGFGRDGFGRGFGLDGGGRGRRRMFDSGELRLVLLLLMEAEPRHGYDLIREIETRTGGAYAPSPGIVYPTLTMLEELGQIATATQEGPRKLFAITEAGRAHLDENRAEAQAALARLEALAAGEGERGDAGPVWRAMHNLKAALAMRLRGSNDKDTLFAVADIIDEAARKIERLP
jgi:DNA-binding PadR family transcriptional regulator